MLCREKETVLEMLDDLTGIFVCQYERRLVDPSVEQLLLECWLM